MQAGISGQDVGEYRSGKMDIGSVVDEPFQSH
jgi:hypothetical protein